MIDFKLKYQAAIFIDAKEIVPNPKTITTLINKFEDYQLIPNTIQELSNEGPHARLSFRSQDGEWEIRFGRNKVDIEKNPTDLKGTNLGSLNNFGAEVKNISKLIFDVIGKKSNRLALISTYLLDEMDNDRLNQIFNSIFNAPKFYQKNIPIEWNSRMVTRVKRDFDGISEIFNFIYQLNRIQGNMQRKGTYIDIDRIQLKLDINTYQKNTDPRFNSKDTQAFFGNASTWEEDFKNEMIKFIS